MGILDGKVALITGTGNGQGRAAALAFARAGATVVGCDWAEAAAAETVEIVRAAGHDMASMHPLDVGAEGAAQRWADWAAATYGGIDILYNNAASNRAKGPFIRTTLAEFEQTIFYEVTIVFIAAQAVWRHMVARGGGLILNTASANAYRDFSPLRLPAHGAGKSGVIALSRMLASEGGAHNIRSISLSPGMIHTRLNDMFFTGNPRQRAVGAEMVRKIPLGRFGTCEEVAEVACFLASPAAAYINATDIVIDGGMTGTAYAPSTDTDDDAFPYGAVPMARADD